MLEREVVITGGTGGLGCAVTRAALEQGAVVTVPYLFESELARLDDLNDELKARLTLVRCDVADEAQVRALMDARPRVDVLLHLVGGFTMGPTEQVSLDDWRSHQDLTLTTTFLCVKHALRRMKTSGYGRIVTIGSKAVDIAMAQTAAYSAAKAAVVALTRVVAEEMKGTDITANCVMPSIIDTAANREAMGEEQAATWVKPQALASVVCFLATEAARDLRGACVPVYGDV